MTRIGLIIGSGTGPELADVFKQSMDRISRLVGKPVEIVECEHQFHSYYQTAGWTPARIEAAVKDDVRRLEAFYQAHYGNGGRAIFRTAFNAETLYRFRAIGKAVKTVYIALQEKRLLLIRDETQGFYVNDSYHVDEREIRFCGSFSLAGFQTITEYSLGEAERVLKKDYDIWVLYKHHLFANVLESWTHKLLDRAKIYQPNQATDLLLSYLEGNSNADLLLITGNEVGDILHEVLIHTLELGTRNSLCSKNIYLHEDYRGLVEYQTVHGSADDIAGQGLVNPVATLRAAAALVEDQLSHEGFSALMGAAIKSAERAGMIGPDAGGRSSTSEIVEAVLARAEADFRSV